MKLFCALLLFCLVNALIVEATYYDQGVYTTYRVRRSGVKSTSGGQYVQQRVESSGSYDSGAQRGSVRALPPRPSSPRYQQSGQYYQEEQYSGGGGNQLQQTGQADAEPASYGGVQGVPGKDFPAYGQVPRTRFTCSGVPYEPGMYADEETQCQAYHVCFQGRKESFLCGVGTVFNQAILACDYWHSVECSRSREFYSANEELGKAGAEPSSGGGGNTQGKWQQQQQQQQRQQQQRQQPRPQPPPRQQYQQQQQQQYTSNNQYDQSAVTGQQWGQQQPQPQPQPQPQYQPQQQVQYVRNKSPARQYPPARQSPAQYSQVQSSSVQQYSSRSTGQQQQQQVQSVSQYSDQAAVRAQVVAPAPAPAPVQRPAVQRYNKSKYRSGAAGNQISPSYRSKALAQVQQQQQYDGQYTVQQPQQPYRAPQQQQQQPRPYKSQPAQVQVDTFTDTQQKLVY